MRKLKLHEMLIGATNLVGGAGGGCLLKAL